MKEKGKLDLKGFLDAVYIMFAGISKIVIFIVVLSYIFQNNTTPESLNTFKWYSFVIFTYWSLYPMIRPLLTKEEELSK